MMTCPFCRLPYIDFAHLDLCRALHNESQDAGENATPAEMKARAEEQAIAARWNGNDDQGELFDALAKEYAPLKLPTHTIQEANDKR